ncbi:hypothetical protein BESB_082750 [Besnoitia besnoiti]|uniref:Uncharacterized protein n=1 Tax=Besnoitia besnoiti TaxID=94643 RepID=A0A2A9MAW5_BESBE|nr:hypothetical protein BESB_082750 [Besnoitia besnoiti]PFH33076.1 hypothetical protein BESB_082750 [Besnoitia besnoiti]
MGQLLQLQHLAAEWLHNNTKVLIADSWNSTLPLSPGDIIIVAPVTRGYSSTGQNETDDLSVFNTDGRPSQPPMRLPMMHKKKRPTTSNDSTQHNLHGSSLGPNSGSDEHPHAGGPEDHTIEEKDELQQTPSSETSELNTQRNGDSKTAEMTGHATTTSRGESSRLSHAQEAGGELTVTQSGANVIQALLKGVRQFLRSLPPHALSAPEPTGDKDADAASSGNEDSDVSVKLANTDVQETATSREQHGEPEDETATEEVHSLKSSRMRNSKIAASAVTRRCAGGGSSQNEDSPALDSCAFDDEAYEFLDKVTRTGSGARMSPSNKYHRRQREGDSNDPSCVLWRQGCRICGCFSGDVICSPYCALGPAAYGRHPVTTPDPDESEAVSPTELSPDIDGWSCCLMEKQEVDKHPTLFKTAMQIIRSVPYGMWDDGIKPRERGRKSESPELNGDQNRADQNDTRAASPTEPAPASAASTEVQTVASVQEDRKDRNKRTRTGGSPSVEDSEQMQSHNAEHSGLQPLDLPPAADRNTSEADDHRGEGTYNSTLPSVITEALSNSSSLITQNITKAAIEAATRAAVEAAAKAAFEVAHAAFEAAIGPARDQQVSLGEDAVPKVDEDATKEGMSERLEDAHRSRPDQSNGEANTAPPPSSSSLNVSVPPFAAAAVSSAYQEQHHSATGDAALMAALAAALTEQNSGGTSATTILSGPGQLANLLLQQLSSQQGTGLTTHQSQNPQGNSLLAQQAASAEVSPSRTPAGRPTDGMELAQTRKEKEGDPYGGPPAACPPSCEIYFDGCTSCRCFDGGALCRARTCSRLVSAPTCLKGEYAYASHRQQTEVFPLRTL